jgi:hypothetical protein
MVFNILSLLVFALSGAAIVFYVLRKRVKKEKNEPAYEPHKDDPIIHIRNKHFLEIPVEKILLGYFVLVLLTYITRLFFGDWLPEIDLVVLYLSGLVFSIAVYKMIMSVSVVNKFSPWLMISLIFSLVIFVFTYWNITENFVDLLSNTREYHLAAHLLGLAMGLGGTLVIDIMFSHFMRKYTISKRESVIMHLVSQMIILGLFLLLLSGAALALIDLEAFLDNPRFIMKMIAVLVVMMNGAALNLYLTPQMKKISLKEEDRGRYEKLVKISFALGAISIVSWVSAFLLAMLKDLFDMPLTTLLTGYVALLVLAAAGSQLAKVYYEKKEEEEDN